MTYDPSEALARVDNDRALLCMLIDVFLKEKAGYMARLNGAYEQQDITALGDAAHNVKGASGAIGLEACRSLAATLEVACRKAGTQGIDGLSESTKALVNTLAQCDEALLSWKTKNQA
ncbi:Hpt domain-containing protein [Limnobacter sp.]|uniref:Hpt domain-containing protein n=1 Tax=Limnobacter sp. TaxID=2003368 RepID=UPI0035119661